MPTIYLNNFRGFKKSYLTLTDVNFLVGENSTGKTSILKLIKLLSDPRFWFTFDKTDAKYILKEERFYPCYYPTNRNVKNTIKNTILAFKILRKEKPDLIISALCQL